MQSLPLSHVRKDLPKIVQAVHEEFDRVTITVNGKSKAVVLAPEELEAYEETIATLSDSAAVQALVQAEADWEAGKTVSHEDVFGA